MERRARFFSGPLVRVVALPTANPPPDPDPVPDPSPLAEPAAPGARADGSAALRLTAARALDALGFVVAAYDAQRRVLLLREGVGAPLTLAVGLALDTALIAVLAWCAGRRRRGSAARLAWLAAELMLLALPVHGLGALSQSTPTNFGSHAWIAQEWAKLPANLALVARVAGPWAIPPVALVLALAHAAGSRAGRLAAALVAGGAIVASIRLIGEMGADDRIVLYGAVFGLPWLAVAAAGLTGRPRWLTRSGMVASLTALLLASYAGLVPVGHADAFGVAPGVRRVYPAEGHEAAFPLAFLRDFRVDPARGFLYTSFGPTSGLVRIGLGDGVATLIPTPDDLVRHLAPATGTAELFALEWVHGELLTLATEPFAITRRLPLTGPRRYVPMSFLVGRERLAVVFTEEPGLAEIDRGSGAVGRTLDFRALGLTRFRSGAWEAVGDVDDGVMFVEIGATDERGGYTLARIDLESFAVAASAPLPDGGLGLLRIPAHGAVLSAGFFTDRLAELDERTLAVRRILRGPLNCRALVYDGRRDVILASAFLPGELWAIRYADGAVLKRDRIGNKSLSMALDATGDRLYVGNRDGIFEVDLARYLGDGDSPPPAVDAR